MKEIVTEILDKDNVVCIDSFLSNKMCAEIMEELKYCMWKPSAVLYQGNPKNSITHHSRVSQSADQLFFSDELNEILKHLENEIKAIFNPDLQKLEYWQATKYAKNEKFDYHYDGGNLAMEKGGERVKTYLLYLNDVKRGGETHFKHLGIKIKPKRGRLLVWKNLLANGKTNQTMLHAGLPLIKGKKTTLVTWERQKKIRN